MGIGSPAGQNSPPGPRKDGCRQTVFQKIPARRRHQAIRPARMATVQTRLGWLRHLSGIRSDTHWPPIGFIWSVLDNRNLESMGDGRMNDIQKNNGHRSGSIPFDSAMQ
jgi:hypothetical protein